MDTPTGHMMDRQDEAGFLLSLMLLLLIALYLFYYYVGVLHNETDIKRDTREEVNFLIMLRNDELRHIIMRNGK